jgi:hypothetical protein
MLKIISNWLSAAKNKKQFKNYFCVTWDDVYVCIESKLPNRIALTESFKWQDIEKICLEAKSKKYSDEIYFFTSDRLEAYIVPVEANGGHRLLEMLIVKKLFDAQLAKNAISSAEGLFWWPNTNSILK